MLNRVEHEKSFKTSGPGLSPLKHTPKFRSTDLILLHSERPTLYKILAFLNAVGLN